MRKELCGNYCEDGNGKPMRAWDWITLENGNRRKVCIECFKAYEENKKDGR